MKIKSFYMAVCLLLLVPNVYAVPNSISATGLTVTYVQILDHGGFVVEFDSVVNTACTANGPKTVFFYSGQNYVTQDGLKALLSGALTALTTGMKVDIIHDDSDVYCWGRYLTLRK